VNVFSRVWGNLRFAIPALSPYLRPMLHKELEVLPPLCGITRLFREAWHHMEGLMRILTLAIMMIAAILAAPSARAQTYSGGPVCLRWAHSYDCTYTSLPQCNAAASGRTAQCFINPFFASAQVPAGYWRYRRAY
jgi:hypothetical protein